MKDPETLQKQDAIKNIIELEEEILRLRELIEEYERRIEEASNCLYADSDGIGDIDTARRILNGRQ